MAAIPQKTLVVGASDATGRAIIQELVSAGMDVVVGDLAKPETLKDALAGVANVLLLSPPDPKQLELQGNLLAAAQTAGVQHIVKVSALGAAEDSPFVIGRWHFQTEQQLSQSGIPFTILRPNMFMQNILGYAPLIAADRSFLAAMGEGKVSLVDARDIAAAAVVVLTTDGHAGKVYELTGPEALTYAELAEKISKEAGGQVIYTDVPPTELKEKMVSSGIPEWFAAAMSDLYVAGQSGALAKVTETLKQLIGTPPRSFAAFVHENAPAFQGENDGSDD